MNLMIATVGVDPGWLASSGSSGGVLCVAVFGALGLILLFAAARLLQGRQSGQNSHRCEF